MSIVDELKDDLTNEIDRIFTCICESEDVDEMGKFTLRYRNAEDIYDGRRHSGQTVIATDDAGSLEYAYRLRFPEKDNRPRRTYWYYDERGWSDEQQLLAEQGHIVSTVEWVERNTDISEITEDDVEILKDMFEELEGNIESLRSTYEIEDVVEAVQNHNEEFLQNRIAVDERSAVELWKLLYSKSSDNLEKNKVSVEYRDDKIALFTSTRTYHGVDKTREYPFILVVRKEENTSQQFFVHRISRNVWLEDKDSWDRRSVRELLGYTSSYTDEQFERVEDASTLLRGNIRVVPKDYSTVRDSYRRQLKGEVEDRIVRLYKEFYNDKNNIDVTSVNKLGFGKYGISIRDDATTGELKSIQEELGIDEEVVREIQDERGIGRLSANLRSEIIEDLYIQNVCEWVYNRPSNELQQFISNNSPSNAFRNHRLQRIDDGSKIPEVEDILIDNPDDIDEKQIDELVEYFVGQEFDSNQESMTFSINDYRIEIECATELPMNYKADDYKIKMKVIVPEESEIEISDPSSKAVRTKLSKGVYEFREVEEFDTSRF